MKKLTALAVLLTVMGTAAFASTGPLGDNSSFKLTAKSDSKYELVYTSSQAEDVRVTIYDNEGRNISSSTVKDATKFKRTFDFSKLEPGNYKIVVKDEDGIAREEVAHLVKKVRLQSFVTQIPDTKSIKLHVGDFNFDEPVKVKIYNAKDVLIHKDEINNAQAFSRIYNLNKAKSGDVTVSIENDGDTKTFTRKLK